MKEKQPSVHFAPRGLFLQRVQEKQHSAHSVNLDLFLQRVQEKQPSVAIARMLLGVPLTAVAKRGNMGQLLFLVGYPANVVHRVGMVITLA